MEILPEHKKVASQVSVILDTFVKSETHIRPHFMLTGSTGTGKSALIKHLAEKFETNFIEINAAQLTAEGISGNSLSKALSPLKNYQDSPVIVFVDEFDKMFINSSDCSTPSLSVQDEFLKVLESDSTSVFGDYGKYVPVNTSNVLYVFAGAFSTLKSVAAVDDLKQAGVRPEFLGRVNLLFKLDKVSLSSFKAALANHSLLQHYLNTYPQFNKAKVVKDLNLSIEKAYTQNTIGLRLITSLLHQYFINKLIESK